jgi:polyisoprenoid-binding protein YceI
MRYVWEPSQSRFTVQGFARGMLAGFGHNPTFTVREFSGELDISPEAPTEASLRLAIKPESLRVTGSVSPKDREEIESRMRQEVLETAVFPEIVYQSAQISADQIADNWYRLQINGELSLHGVKKTQPVDMQLRLSEDQARLTGQCALLQSAYRIKRVSALGGMIHLQDELKLDFDIAGRPQEG